MPEVDARGGVTCGLRLIGGVLQETNYMYVTLGDSTYCSGSLAVLEALG